MAQLNLKGDVESVRKPQLDFITDVLKKRGFKNAEVTIESMGQAGDNYMSNVKKIVVTENGQTLNIVAKLATENPVMRELMNIKQCFNNEHVIYTELLPKFRQLQKSVEVPEEDLFRFAECYGSSLVEPHEVILLENMTKHNYGMLDRFEPLSYDCVKIVLKQFAIYHSLSYVLKYHEPETYTAIVAKMIDSFKDTKAYSEQTKMALKKVEDDAIAIMAEDKHKKALKGTTSVMVHQVSKLKDDIGSKYSIIQQGDGWTNNILFKLEGDKPVNCVLIDYQNSRENHPAFDIMYMMFNSTSHEQRSKHYFEFLDYYHSELDRSLNNFGLKASFVYSRDQLDADIKRNGKLMLSFCMMVSSFILRSVDTAAKVQNSMQNNSVQSTDDMFSTMVVQDKETVNLYRSKITGMVESFLQFGLI